MAQLKTLEFDNLMAGFERIYKRNRLDREDRQFWRLGVVYQHGETNAAFNFFHQGYEYAKCLARIDDLPLDS